MKIMLCSKSSTQTGGIELLDKWRSTQNTWIWVDLYEEDLEHELNFLTQNFGLDKHAIIEAQRLRHPPSFIGFENYIYILLKPLDSTSDSLDFTTLQMAMFASDRFLITRHTKHSPFLAKLWEKQENQLGFNENPLSIVSAMCSRIAQRYGKVLLDLEQRLDIIEDELFESPSDTLMKELIGYNTGLRKMHRILTYYVSIFDAIRLHFDAPDNNRNFDDFDDIYAQIERFNSLSELYQNVITDLIEAYISLNGHHLNQIMKVLTIVTVIFVPLTLLVGIYGMNFENMPELKSDYGYYILISVMAIIASLLLFLFRRVRWL
ncbi:MAG TPA: magnesium transporter CorA family protein [Gammaproteobacteria bacterium]